jgi:hypothetical protein
MHGLANCKRDGLFLRQQWNSSARQKNENFLNTRILFPKLYQIFHFYKNYLTSQKNTVILHAQIDYERYHLQLHTSLDYSRISFDTNLCLFFQIIQIFHVSTSK